MPIVMAHLVPVVGGWLHRFSLESLRFRTHRIETEPDQTGAEVVQMAQEALGLRPGELPLIASIPYRLGNDAWYKDMPLHGLRSSWSREASGAPIRWITSSSPRSSTSQSYFSPELALTAPAAVASACEHGVSLSRYLFAAGRTKRRAAARGLVPASSRLLRGNGGGKLPFAMGTGGLEHFVPGCSTDELDEVGRLRPLYGAANVTGDSHCPGGSKRRGTAPMWPR